MVDSQINQSSGSLDWLGVITCSGALAYVQWFLNRDSIDVPEVQNLIKYLLVDMVCFSAALLVARRLFSSHDRFFRYSFAVLPGAIVSTLIIDLPFFYRDIPNWKGDTSGWFVACWNHHIVELHNSYISYDDYLRYGLYR